MPEAALPLYLYRNTPSIGAWGSSDEHAGFCGRIIVWRPEQGGRVDHGSVERLCKTDIVAVPEEDAHLLPEIAPRVEAVIVGNLGCELSMAEYGDDLHGNIAQDFVQIAEDQRWFIDTQAEAIHKAGGRPAFAPVPTEILTDIYINGAAMRDAIVENAATFISFNAPSLWTAMGGGDAVYGLLKQYIEGMDAIAGMEWLNGLAIGNDRRAAAHGFRAGVLGNSWRDDDDGDA